MEQPALRGAGRRRDKIPIAFRVSDEEEATILVAARRSDMTPGQYARESAYLRAVGQLVMAAAAPGTGRASPTDRPDIVYDE